MAPEGNTGRDLIHDVTVMGTIGWRVRAEGEMDAGIDALKEEAGGGQPCAFQVMNGSLWVGERVKANTSIDMPPR